MTNLFWPILFWPIFGIITIILLIVFWQKRSAVWGGFTVGVFVGLAIAIFFAFKGNGFDWHIIWKGGVAGTMLGFIAELLGKISDKIKNKKSKN